jgi:UrcA family protein
VYFLPLELTRRPGWTFAAALVASTLLLTACGASVAFAAEPERPPSIAVRVPHNALRSPAKARQVLARLGRAALEVCGGSSFSLLQYHEAVVRSRCYREALNRAVQDAGSPVLAEAFAQLRHGRTG